MLWKGGVIVRIVIIIYLAIWGWFAYRQYVCTHKSEDVSLRVLEKAKINRFRAKSLGIALALFIMILLTCMLPNVEVVTYAASTKSLYSDCRWAKYDYIRYYIPFYWNGKTYRAFENYLFNNTSDTLAMYQITLSNGKYYHVTEPSEFGYIAPQEIAEINHSISHYFSPTDEKNYADHDFKKKYAFKEVSEWNLDTKQGALESVSKINNYIRYPDIPRWAVEEYIDSMAGVRILEMYGIKRNKIDANDSTVSDSK